MGLRTAFARLATRHAHVLAVEVPGQWQVRVAVERAVLTRGWSLASSPADADVLAVCGLPGPEMAEAIDAVWKQLPGPRVRIDVHENGEASTALDEAHTRLLDTGSHRRDARERPSAADLLDTSEMGHGEMDHGDMDHGEMDHGDMGHGEMDHGEMDHGDMDHGEMDHGGMDHGEMDHGDMEMAPGGIALAEGGEDRDGLEMDVLHVPLGPVLPYWPAGLVVRCALQGDVIVDATVELLDGGSATEFGETAAEGVARSIDSLVSLLALAGWEDPAAEARGIRDAVLETGSTAVLERFERCGRRVRRSRLLRFALKGIRPLDAEDIESEGMPARFAGDTHDRLLTMLDDISRQLAGERVPGPTSPTLEHVAQLVTGLDLATARLVVASLDLHELTRSAQREESHAH